MKTILIILIALTAYILFRPEPPKTLSVPPIAGLEGAVSGGYDLSEILK